MMRTSSGRIRSLAIRLRTTNIPIQPHQPSPHPRPSIPQQLSKTTWRPSSTSLKPGDENRREPSPPPTATWNLIKSLPSLPASQKRHAEAIVANLQTTQQTLDKLYTRIAHTRYGRLMRLDKPIGSHLLFLPSAWGISIAATSVPEFLSLTAIFYGGAVLLRGAGCTANDIWDADIDRKVSRTRGRPIAAGEVSVRGAVAFLGTQLCAGLVILSQLNGTAFLVGSLSVIPALYYPLAKRRLRHPQAILGVTFNSGALLGFAAACDSLAMPAVYLYGAGWCWTMVYDTLYAHQDLREDRLVGVLSSAREFDGDTKRVLGMFVGGKLALLTAAGLSADLSLPFFMGISAACMQLGRVVYDADLADGAGCHRAFVSNSGIGVMTWLAIIAGRF